MILGPHYTNNGERFSKTSDSEWRTVLYKCKKHIRIRLKQKTITGAHAASTVGGDPVDHYLSLVYTKLLAGEWEWKPDYSLLQQMIRAIDSEISKQIEKYTTKKSESLRISYTDITDEFYVDDDVPYDEEQDKHYQTQVEALNDAAKGDTELELIVDAIKEGMKRADIAELLGKTPKQFDKLKEKLINKIKKVKQQD